MIKEAEQSDLKEIVEIDKEAPLPVLKKKIERKEVLVMKAKEEVVGYLRYSLFWDNTPFINLLYIDERIRNSGKGKELVSRWERMMGAEGFERVMTSSQSDESAQHFFRKIGYRDIGSFEFPGQAKELLFMKELGEHLPNKTVP